MGNTICCVDRVQLPEEQFKTNGIADKKHFEESDDNVVIRDSIKSYDYDKYKPYKYLLKSYLKNYNWINQK